MEYDRQPLPLSDEDVEAILEEMANPPKDTPERRATFALAREMAAVRRRMKSAEEAGVRHGNT